MTFFTYAIGEIFQSACTPSGDHGSSTKCWIWLKNGPKSGHPASRPGATGLVGELHLSVAGVSILTRPRGRVLPEALGGVVEWEDVSILTRPRGRVLPYSRPGAFLVATRFQSSPGLAAGCYLQELIGFVSVQRFQSSPGLAAGCYCGSIGSVATSGSFNPHPASRPGATAGHLWASALLGLFQSSPGLAAGCYGSRWSGCPRQTCFNPHPASRPGATDLVALLVALVDVSILTRPRGRVLPLPVISAHAARAQFQSSPGLAAGCYEGAQGSPLPGNCFNPHPASRPGATREYTMVGLARRLFQSSPGLAAGCYGTTLISSPGRQSFNPHPASRPGATW